MLLRSSPPAPTTFATRPFLVNCGIVPVVTPGVVPLVTKASGWLLLSSRWPARKKEMRSNLPPTVAALFDVPKVPLVLYMSKVWKAPVCLAVASKVSGMRVVISSTPPIELPG